MCIGAVTWGWLSDAAGRRGAFLTSAAVTVFFSFASALAPNYTALLFFRTFVGVGLAGAPVAYALLSEFVPSHGRGFALVAIEGFWTIGTVAEAGLAWAMINDHGWRPLLAISATPLVLLLVLSPWLPESPRYHVVKGHMAKAQKVLQHVARWNGVKLPRGTLHRGHGHATPRATATAGGGDGVAVIDVDVNVDVDEEDFRGKVVVIIIIILKWGYNAAAICGGKD
eukprot:jgi/Chrzof1/6693/Cz19g05280.t1